MATASLLAVSNDAKTIKGEAAGYLTGILYLAPADETGDGHNVCPMSSPGCRTGCLNTAGRGQMSGVQAGRARKRRLYFADRPGFVAQVRRDIAALVRKAARDGLKPAVRLNGTADLAWELLAPALYAEFPTVKFYDYTKIPARARRFLAGKLPANYSLTFSRSECNDRETLAILAAGGNVAVVFGTRKGAVLPATWQGYSVVDGDASDLRFMDPAGVVVGLRAKGQAKHDTTGFVVREDN